MLRLILAPLCVHVTMLAVLTALQSRDWFPQNNESEASDSPVVNAGLGGEDCISLVESGTQAWANCFFIIETTEAV